MDDKKAEELFKQVKGIKIEEIIIEDLIDYGKSAAVFRGKKDNNLFAVKIFDNDVVRKDDFEMHRQRINLELSLKDHKILNLVKIIRGGETTIKSIEYYYLIMEYIEGKNLKRYIETEIIDEKFIVKVANTLLDVTEKLFQNKEPIVHRDIKPENIMVSKKREIILMDMGVIKIVGNPSMTDMTKKEFLGTLRYAPPEFLMRQEEDNLNGWRAVNIYQIGAVLHDLIMKKELFSGVEPYPKLAITIKDDMPSIINNEYHPDLIQLARDMLQKDWKNRLKMNQTDKIKSVLNKCLLSQKEQESESVYNFIKSNAQLIQEKLNDIKTIERSIAEKEKIMQSIHSKIWKIVDECFNDKNIKDIIERIESVEPFKLNMRPDKIPMKRYRLYKIIGKFEFGFTQEFLIFFVLENNESSFCKINVLGIILDIFTTVDLKKPDELIYTLFTDERRCPTPEERISYPLKVKIPPCSMFEGIVDLEDNSLKNTLDKKIAKVIKAAVQKMKPDVEEELKQRRERIDGRSHGGFVSRFVRKPYFITD
jgi:serine/threonine protein kinase